MKAVERPEGANFFKSENTLPVRFAKTFRWKFTACAVISLSERFQARFQSVRQQPPENESPAGFLRVARPPSLPIESGHRCPSGPWVPAMTQLTRRPQTRS